MYIVHSYIEYFVKTYIHHRLFDIVHASGGDPHAECSRRAAITYRWQQRIIQSRSVCVFDCCPGELHVWLPDAYTCQYSVRLLSVHLSVRHPVVNYHRLLRGYCVRCHTLRRRDVADNTRRRICQRARRTHSDAETETAASVRMPTGQGRHRILCCVSGLTFRSAVIIF